MRSIPACAGEPGIHSLAKRGLRVYPRVCGGTVLAGVDIPSTWGLSPRVRGNPYLGHLIDAQSRSIPACAGEPSFACPYFSSESVYPRVCGGTVEARRVGASLYGLSPRVRGNPFLSTSIAVFVGSIPACAGEPVTRSPSSIVLRVYPRVCGGTYIFYAPDGEIAGLSPRVRGNPLADLSGTHYKGSIPACAGEPSILTRVGCISQVYPRVCGGTPRRCGYGCSPGGLSPRVRGNQISPNRPGPLLRSIPACAGEPPEHPESPFFCEVYPRVCGGTRFRPPLTNHCEGLSPRVRGNPR